MSAEYDSGAQQEGKRIDNWEYFNKHNFFKTKLPIGMSFRFSFLIFVYKLSRASVIPLFFHLAT